MLIHGDQSRLDQVLRNFLSNAMKFTPEGGVITVTASVLRDSYECKDGTPIQNQQLLRLSVTDTGPGIAPVRLKLLFSVTPLS